MSIEPVKGKTVAKISRFDLLIDGQENDEDLGSLQLIFLDGSVLELELIGDGESVDYNWKEKEENLGDWHSIDLTSREPFVDLIGNNISEFDELLFGTIEDKPIQMVVAGIGFKFGNQMSLVYYNAGDFAKIYVNEMPPAFTDQFKLIWKKRIF